MTGIPSAEGHYWDIEDLSHYLKVKVKTLYTMVQEIPHYRIGRLIRFKKEEVDLWMSGKQKQHYSKTRAVKHLRSSGMGVARANWKTNDRETSGRYNPAHEKSDQIKGLGKEV